MPGYPKERFVDLSERDGEVLMCGICLDILKDPKDVNCCKRISYCSQCINQWIAENNTCPTCRQNISLESLYDPTLLVVNLINSLNIKCNFAENGCNLNVKVEELSNHEIHCDYNPQKVCIDCEFIGNKEHNCITILKSNKVLLKKEILKLTMFDQNMIQTIREKTLDSAKQAINNGIETDLYMNPKNGELRKKIINIIEKALNDCSDPNDICNQIGSKLKSLDESQLWSVMLLPHNIGWCSIHHDKYFIRLTIGQIKFVIFTKNRY